MGTSRLERSSNARITDIPSLTTYCDTHNIPHTVFAPAVDNVIFPTAKLKADFLHAYKIPSLRSHGLATSGASAIMVFECPIFDEGKQSYHAEVGVAIAEQVGNSLVSGVQAARIHTDMNPNYRSAFDKDRVASVKALIEDQGIPVVMHNREWPDLELVFDDKRDDHFWRATAFVVDSTGNEGMRGKDGKKPHPSQKHDLSFHAPPLVVHVGAASCCGDGLWRIEGYSSANSPTFLAPVMPHLSAVWAEHKSPESITGTSAAGPYCGGVLAALNHIYGAYLTREQILYALAATSTLITDVMPFDPHTPKSKTIAYKQNATGLLYNAEYAGFGLIDPYLADHVLAHMVALTQLKPETITIPTEERIKLEIKNGAKTRRNEDGLYYYDVVMPAGHALKTTLEIDFDKEFGDVKLTSPAGTEFPMIMSRSIKDGTSFGMSTSHAWLGESLAGKWRITSTTPIKGLRLNHHHFLPGDIIHNLDTAKLLRTPTPDLSHAIPLRELSEKHRISRVFNSETIEHPDDPGNEPTIYDTGYKPGSPHPTAAADLRPAA